MPVRRKKRRSSRLFQFDKSYLAQYGVLAGVDEAGCGPLAGPVVAAAVILPASWRHPKLADSKLISADVRRSIFKILEKCALAIGVGIVEADEIDRINIRRAGFAAMRLAISRLATTPVHALIDGFRIPDCEMPHTPIVQGDNKSAHIAAASIIAKVTRDAIMEQWDDEYPVYGFRRHKGYGTKEHLAALLRHGPSPIHRKSFAPVLASSLSEPVLTSE